jgi:hypothetical protein
MPSAEPLRNRIASCPSFSCRHRLQAVQSTPCKAGFAPETCPDCAGMTTKRLGSKFPAQVRSGSYLSGVADGLLWRFSIRSSFDVVQRSAAKAASGAWSNTFNKAFAAPVGLRLPCSQLRMVSRGT